MCDLGRARKFLDLEITQTIDPISEKTIIRLGQEQYVNTIVKRFGLEDAHSV